MNKKTEILLEGTIMAALAMVLHFVPLNIGSSFTISLGQIPLTLFALRRGTKPALFAGLLWGMLYFVTGTAYILTPVQALIEYPIAFTFAGFAGLYHEPLMQAMHDHKEGNFSWCRCALLLAFCCWMGILGCLCFMGNEAMVILSSHEWGKWISLCCSGRNRPINHVFDGAKYFPCVFTPYF